MLAVCLIVAVALGAGALGAARARPRLPVPDEPSQEKARALVLEVFAADYAEARASSPKGAALAGKLLANAVQTARPADRYVLLQLSGEAAARAGDVAAAMRAVRELGTQFQVDATALRLETLKALCRCTKPVDAGEAILRELESLADDRLAADDYPGALEAARLAVDEMRQGRDPALRKRAVAKLGVVDELRGAAGQLESSRQTLAKAPGDPAANRAVGRFECFLKGDWNAGLPHLAKGDVAALKTAAVGDLGAQAVKPSPPAAKMVGVADAWWEIARLEAGTARARIMCRAELWYRTALPGLAGLDKARVEQRLAEAVEAVAAPAAPRAKSRRPPAPKLTIVQAVYGKAKKCIDVTAAVQAAAAKDPFLPIRADKVLTGGIDPAPYQQRVLVLRYQLGKSSFERRLHEGEVETIPPVPQQGLALPEAAQRFRVVAARYGGGVTWLDVTEHMAGLVSDPTKPFNFHAAAVADDEARKSCHALVIWFDYEGRRYVRVFERSRNCLLLP